ncbi:MAG: isoleucine--tRNA ligase [Flavobacteriales bacterium]|jgi:isoleucyl-tRNA synthetase|uniref:isoleucine--tRNA ligase n=1 Tax=Blattabacterium sp. (Mastotermes darwiniensis) TaxID=39768 RepID=UPI000231DEB2|nr:isoleucine--tRNA ligase [Blattabacterium sp. (Mastotermes darwiniensis)]AER40742.1 isoleucyl-tRNA synthetase [Blattabacterium sp. (Mastotermes darwiniensis) str. MADAR]MDR1805125.1 isoleucine--tRNA ligase [Flavobacteriales bacterium]
MSKRFKEYKKLDLKEIYREIDKFWKKNKIFQKSFQSRNIFSKNKKYSCYVLYEGPPSLNGQPGIHHTVSRTIKDIFCRYHTLKGKKVIRKSGWDTHGLPIELNVEKKIGITKNDIGKSISIEKYNRICKCFVNDSMKKWMEFTEKMGYWLDLEKPFITYNTKYIESVWWLIKKLYHKKILYPDYTIQPYSPSAGTGLSYHELNMPGTYKKVKQIAPILKFKTKKKTLPKEIQEFSGNTYLIVWTTTPWTIPSNTALAIGSNIDYVLVRTYCSYSFSKENIIFAEKLIHKILLPNKFYPVSNNYELDQLNIEKKDNKIPYFIAYKFKGNKLIKSRYEQLLPWFKPYKKEENAFQVVEGHFVNEMEGTGIVHIAPTFGIDDSTVARRNKIPSMLVLNKENIPVPLVDMQGRFLDSYPHGFGGKYVKNDFDPKRNTKSVSVDQEIVSFLEKEKKVFQVEMYTHFYPHCWRTEKPIIYYPLESWFIQTTKSKEKLIFLNKEINWYPKFIGKKRFYSWLKNIKDWNLSRTRYWGTPLPIWRTKDGKEELVIGSIKELILEIKKSIEYGFMSHNILENFIPDDMKDENYEKIDLHRPFIDQIVLVSSRGIPMKREPYLIDVWFDSGAMPYAQFHYPFENKEYIDQCLFFPSDFIAEGIDQTRGWFFTLHTISSLLFNSVAYKNVVSTGLVLDKKGHKMSKSKGNTINPFDLIEHYGPDAIRWYIVFNSEPWENLKFDIKGIHIGINKFFGTLYNVYSFFVLYANIDGFSYQEEDCSLENYTELDLWILSELNTMIKIVDESYSDYNPTKAARTILFFVLEKLSNWYVRLCRRRFWKEEYTKNKISAYQILYKCLITISKLLSPIAPFFSEKLYIDLNSITRKENFESIHLTSFPDFNSSLVNEDLEKRMLLVQKITTMVFSIRKKNGIKIRQPLQRLLILIHDEKIRLGLQQKTYDILKQEINVKNIEFTDPHKYLKLVKHIQPNYRSLGPRFGNKTKEISEIIKKFSQENIQEIELKKKYIFSFQGEKIALFLKDVKITTEFIGNWSILFDNELTIALDLEITSFLWEEGLIREIIRHIQKLRKKCKYKVIDKIFLYINAIQKIQSIIHKNKEFICQETLSVDLVLEENIKRKGIKVDFEKDSIYILIRRE